VCEDDFNFLSKMCLAKSRELAFWMAQTAQDAGIQATAHGSDASDHADAYLAAGFSTVIVGEVEATLLELAQGRLAETIAGLAFACERGVHRVVHQNVPRKLRTDLDSLPMPAWHLVDMDRYRDAWSATHGMFSLNMASSRGCPYRCNWCAKPISGNKFHLRAAAAVAEEMRLLKEEAKADHIWFGDDVFALNDHWVEEFAAEVTKRNAAVPFKIQSRADLMSEKTVQHLKAAGCDEVWMGVESGSQAILNAMDKGLKLSSVITARNLLKKAGIRACYFLQLGYPGETWTELQETIAFVRETRPDDIGISFSYPLPGTVFYEHVQAELGQKRNWTDSDDLCIMFNAAYKTDFYRAVRDALHAEVDSWWKPEESDVAHAQIDALWCRVDELEPVSRDADALASAEKMAPAVSAAFVPIEALASVMGN
jgi:radical SAM superfamily enzyme YgiQ (UPF0313 family)